MDTGRSNSSLFVKRIREKLRLLPEDGEILLRVSVAAKARWEKTDSEDEVLVRWACWTVERHGKEITAPEFEVLSDQVTREQLARELPSFFPGVEVIVDEDIDVPD